MSDSQKNTELGFPPRQSGPSTQMNCSLDWPLLSTPEFERKVALEVHTIHISLVGCQQTRVD